MTKEDAKRICEPFVRSPLYYETFHSIITGISTGESDSKSAGTPDALLVSHGKMLGALEVFKAIELSAKHVKMPETKDQSKPKVDPDLQ